MKRYGQFCGLARSAEVLGERWTLLILRDLAVAPARFSELRAGLPGLAATMLVQRLRDLEAEGIVERAEHVPGVSSYGLTDHGRTVVPALTALSLWGASSMPFPRTGEQVTDRSLAAMLLTTRTAERVEPFSLEVRAGPAAALAQVTADAVIVSPGPAPAADLSLAGPGLRAMLARSALAADLLASGALTARGRLDLLDGVTRAFHAPLDGRPPSGSPVADHG